MYTSKKLQTEINNFFIEKNPLMYSLYCFINCKKTRKQVIKVKKKKLSRMFYIVYLPRENQYLN